jgi:hypothetical protein
MVAMMVSALFLSVLPGFYLSSVKIWQRENSELEAAGAADFALNRMEEDVRNARRVVVASDGTSVTLTLPLRAYDADLGRKVNVLDAHGSLVDGDSVQYYYVSDGSSTGSHEGSLYRRFIYANGSSNEPRMVAAHVQPGLNPLDSGGSTVPLFRYEASTRTLAVTVSVAEPKASAGTFAPTDTIVQCTREGAPLQRVATEAHPEGEIRCRECGTELRTSAEIASYSTQLLLRNE